MVHDVPDPVEGEGKEWSALFRQLVEQKHLRRYFGEEELTELLRELAARVYPEPHPSRHYRIDPWRFETHVLDHEGAAVLHFRRLNLLAMEPSCGLGSETFHLFGRRLPAQGGGVRTPGEAVGARSYLNPREWIEEGS